LLDARNPACELEVEGGIGRENIRAVVEAGAQVIVMGSSIFRASDPGAEVRALRAIGEGV
jgi:ribulose-phosphate 3-epimerase